MLSRRWLLLIPCVALFVFGLIILQESRESSGAPSKPAVTSTARPQKLVKPTTGPTKKKQAPDPSSDAEPAIDETELHRLEGQVVDDEQRPIRGAKVTAMAGANPTTFTEADGSFVIDAVPGGITTVIAERGDLYAEDRLHWIGADSDPVILTMKRGAPLTVRVLEVSTNKPIAGAKVDVGHREGTTGANGVLKLRSIEVDYERITVEATGFGSYKSRLEIDSEHPYKPQSITVHLGRAALVSGTVVDDGNKPVPEARVWIESASGTWDDIVTADANGAWSLETLAAGTHAVKATSDRHLERPAIVFEYDGKRPKTGIVVRVSLGAELAGRVVDTAGKPVAGASIRGVSASDTDADGKFLAQGLEPGDRDISASQGSRGSVETNVKIPAVGRVEVTIVIAESSLAGTVVDAHGDPIPDASVWARGMGDSYTHMYDDADEFGKFDFGGIPLGEYELVAQRAEESRRPLPDKGNGLVVKTTEPGARTLKVVAPSISTVAGRVTLGGKPVAFFGVVITKDATSVAYESPMVVHDPKGEFAQKDIATGTWSVVIAGPGFITKTINNVRVVEGSPTNLGTIAVELGRIVRGRVTDVRGAPLANALVTVTVRSLFDEKDRVREALRGNASARTDASGRYEVLGLDPNESDLTVSAIHDRGASESYELKAGDTTVDLVISPTGELTGAIKNMSGSQLSVVARPVNDFFRRYSGDIDVGGGFRIPNIPPGTYKVTVMGRNALPTLTVTITESKSTTVTFTMPATPITLDVTAKGCKIISLEAADSSQSESFAYNTCDDQGVSALEHLSPGAYKVCVDLDICAPVVVAPSPAHQRFTVPTSAKP